MWFKISSDNARCAILTLTHRVIRLYAHIPALQLWWHSNAIKSLSFISKSLSLISNLCTCHTDPHYLKIIHILILNRFFCLKCLFWLLFVRNMIKLIISCLNVSFKMFIVRLQLHPKLIASDYITTGRPLGRKKGCSHMCDSPGSLEWGQWILVGKPG